MFLLGKFGQMWRCTLRACRRLWACDQQVGPGLGFGHTCGEVRGVGLLFSPVLSPALVQAAASRTEQPSSFAFPPRARVGWGRGENAVHWVKAVSSVNRHCGENVMVSFQGQCNSHTSEARQVCDSGFGEQCLKSLIGH